MAANLDIWILPLNEVQIYPLDHKENHIMGGNPVINSNRGLISKKTMCISKKNHSKFSIVNFQRRYGPIPYRNKQDHENFFYISLRKL